MTICIFHHNSMVYSKINWKHSELGGNITSLSSYRFWRVWLVSKSSCLRYFIFDLYRRRENKLLFCFDEQIRECGGAFTVGTTLHRAPAMWKWLSWDSFVMLYLISSMGHWWGSGLRYIRRCIPQNYSLAVMFVYSSRYEKPCIALVIACQRYINLVRSIGPTSWHMFA